MLNHSDRSGLYLLTKVAAPGSRWILPDELVARGGYDAAGKQVMI
jgi:hypothetical protein